MILVVMWAFTIAVTAAGIACVAAVVADTIALARLEHRWWWRDPRRAFPRARIIRRRGARS